MNLVPAGVAFKAGKLVRGGGRAAEFLKGTFLERGFVNPRPLGVAGEQESIASFLGDALRAKNAKNAGPAALAPEQFTDEVVMRAHDGRKFLVNTAENHVVDLETGELLDLADDITEFAGRSIDDIIRNSPRAVERIPKLLEDQRALARRFEEQAARA